MTSHTFVFEINYKRASSGWMACWITIDGERHTIWASYAFPPFLPLLRFVADVAGQRFPAEFIWDEEGVCVECTATAIPEDSSLVHLFIEHYEEDLPWFNGEVEREVIIQAFLPPIVEFATKSLMAGIRWETPKEAVNEIQQEIFKSLHS